MIMQLQDVIRVLSEYPDQDKVIESGFAKPHSYRGYYDRLAFEPVRDIKVSEMLRAASSALGATYEGYKGGDYTMCQNTAVYVAEYGCITDDCLTEGMLKRMLDNRTTEPPKVWWDPVLLRLYNEFDWDAEYVPDRAILLVPAVSPTPEETKP